MQQIPRDSWQMIQKVIRRYPENIELYRNKREELLESSPSQDGLPRGNLPANKMEQAVIELNSPYMQRLQREIEAVEKAYEKVREAVSYTHLTLPTTSRV